MTSLGFLKKGIQNNYLISWSYFEKKLIVSHSQNQELHVYLKIIGILAKVPVLGFFLLFPRCCHQVLTGFSTCSPISQYVSQHVPNSTSLCPIALPNVIILLEPIELGGHRDLHFSMFGVNTSFRTFFCYGPIKEAHCKKNSELGSKSPTK